MNVLRAISIAVSLLFAFTAATPAQSRNPTADNSQQNFCSVSGMVVELAGSAPIKSAIVRVESTDDHSRTLSISTDVSGHFELKGIAPGGYRLRVIRNGFVTAEYGQRKPADPGAVLTLAPGRKLTDLLFRLVPSALISGRIRDEDGNPLPWVRVSALRAAYQRGQRRLISEVTVVTNDLGEYRLFGLRPGRYYLSANYKPGRRLESAEDDADSTDSSKSGYVPTYYPGSPDPARAIAIPVKSAEEIHSIDILLEPTTVYSIRGHAMVLGPRRSADGIVLVLEPRTSGLDWSVSNRQATVDKADGSFEISGVTTGSYTLVASWFESGFRYQARQTVDISNADAEGIQLTLTNGMTVSGQIVWDPRPSLDRDALTVSVRGADSAVAFGAQARVAANGVFSLQNVSDGLYRLATFGQSADCYVKSIRYAGMEVSDDEFNVVRGTQATLEVTISSRGARVQGAVKDADSLPAVGVWVVLVPDGVRQSEFHRFKQKITDQYGHFDLRGIAPGDYTLYSWEQIEPGSWEDPDFLKQFEGKGGRLSLQEGELKSLDLTAIRTASNDQEK